jgi:SET domain-containing protein
LPGSGKGLFTRIPIKKGEDVVEYKGDVIPWSECLLREEKGKGDYFMYVSSKNCIDAGPTKQHLARYANDARGYAKVEGLTNNSFYETRGKRVFIVARKNIPADAEIFVGYGKQYWDTHQEEMREKRTKNRVTGRKQP